MKTLNIDHVKKMFIVYPIEDIIRRINPQKPSSLPLDEVFNLIYRNIYNLNCKLTIQGSAE